MLLLCICSTTALCHEGLYFGYAYSWRNFKWCGDSGFLLNNSATAASLVCNTDIICSFLPHGEGSALVSHIHLVLPWAPDEPQHTGPAHRTQWRDFLFSVLRRIYRRPGLGPSVTFPWEGAGGAAGERKGGRETSAPRDSSSAICYLQPRAARAAGLILAPLLGPGTSGRPPHGPTTVPQSGASPRTCEEGARTR